MSAIRKMKGSLMSFSKVLWFIGGFALGLTLLSVGHAALPNRVAASQAPMNAQANTPANVPVSEINSQKVSAPDLDQEYSRLSSVEGQYAESWDQQQKLKSATNQVALSERPHAKKAARKKQ